MHRHNLFSDAAAGVVMLLLFAGTALVTDVIGANEKHRQICISFDELPAAETFGERDPNAVMPPIIAALEKHDVKAIGFVVGQRIDDSFDMLGEWLNKSNRLGNLTYSHSDLHEMGIEAFIKDIQAGERALEPMLKGFGQQPRFFRYPFLHYGTTVEARRQVQMYLEENNIQVVPATVIVEDYLYNLSLQKHGGELDSTEYDHLLNEYVNHVLDQIEAAERKSRSLLGRNCRQILQLRANRLNALFLDDMLTAMEDMGYEFVSVDAALRDRVYDRPQAYFGNKGVGYLDMLELSNPDLLPAGE